MYSIKQKPEDFVVQEITVSKKVLDKNFKFKKSEGDQLICVLKKTNWDTISATSEIAKRLHISKSRIGYAGMKDKRAVTTQLISIFNVKKEDIEKIKIKDIELFPIKYSNEKILLGDLHGNNFKIIVDSNKKPKQVTKVPNYYGEQRFGTLRKNTHIVGKALIEEDFEKAVMIYLTEIGNEEEETTNARKKLAKEKDFKASYEYFPKHLKFERILLNKLVEKEDYISALKALPGKLLIMFIHAYQSKLFNEFLDEVIKRKLDHTEGPLFGYKYEIQNDLEKEILERNKIWTDNFLIREFPKLSSKGKKRNLFVDVKDLKIKEIEKNKYLIEFSLAKSAYATVVIDYLFK